MLQGKTINKSRKISNIMPGNLFTLEGINVSFCGKKALSQIQLKVGKREIIFITGPSGAGKTTILRVLSGDLVSDSGSFRSVGSNIHVARVFQDLRLIENYSCLENLMVVYDPKIYKGKRAFINDLDELSHLLGITDRLNMKMSQANGGLRQKVAIIRALLSKPDVILLDEPTSSLDLTNAKKLFELLNLYNIKRGLTVVWATHNRDLVRNFNGRIVHLNGGKIVHSGHACFI